MLERLENVQVKSYPAKERVLANVYEQAASKETDPWRIWVINPIEIHEDWPLIAVDDHRAGRECRLGATVTVHE